ncbi:MAG: hypothetical protein FWE05_09925 [Defluviitaleaceae bacterium]|nr:hypothetical protein [Defluviitaleaceae bacterium]
MKHSTLLFIEILAIIITAALIGLFSYHIIYLRLAGGQSFIAYLINLTFIATVLILDIIANKIMTKEGFMTKERTKLGHFFAQVLFAAHFVSFKTALYLFYIVMLIASRTSILHPDFVFSYITGFIYSVEYGILLLIPLDKFLELLTKDDRRILRILHKMNRANKYQDKNELK